MLSADELEDARDDLAAELTDRVMVRRKTGTTLDETTFEEVPVYTTIVADPGVGNSNALVTLDARQVVNVGQVDEPVVLRTYLVTMPADVLGAQTGDQVVVVASGDSEADGQTLTVKEARFGSLAISRRLLCQANLTEG